MVTSCRFEIPLDQVRARTGLSDQDLQNPEYGLEIIRVESAEGAAEVVRWSSNELPAGKRFERLAEMCVASASFKCELASDRLEIGPSRSNAARGPVAGAQSAGSLLIDAFDKVGFDAAFEDGRVVVSGRPPKLGILRFGIPIRVGEVRIHSDVGGSPNEGWVAQLLSSRHGEAFSAAVRSAAELCGVAVRIRSPES